jgi:hypothetical protein
MIRILMLAFSLSLTVSALSASDFVWQSSKPSCSGGVEVGVVFPANGVIWGYYNTSSSPVESYTLYGVTTASDGVSGVIVASVLNALPSVGYYYPESFINVTHDNSDNPANFLNRIPRYAYLGDYDGLDVWARVVHNSTVVYPIDPRGTVFIYHVKNIVIDAYPDCVGEGGGSGGGGSGGDDGSGGWDGSFPSSVCSDATVDTYSWSSLVDCWLANFSNRFSMIGPFNFVPLVWESDDSVYSLGSLPSLGADDASLDMSLFDLGAVQGLFLFVSCLAGVYIVFRSPKNKGVD